MDKVRRVTALITVIVIIALIIGTVICAVTGSEYFFGMLALTFLVPIVLWVFMWFTKLANNNSNNLSEDSNEFDEE